ncbi:UNVERIFIED_CONTAM: hypothetical protein Sindi_3003600, partial [Sesamum indicum]
GVWADGAGRGKAAPRSPQASPSHGLGVACVGLVLAARVRQRTPAGRLSGGLRCCVRPMPICIVCAGMPSRPQRQAVGGELRLRFAKTWPTQAPSKQRLVADRLGAVGIRRSGVLVAALSAIPILGALASSPLPANMEASRAAGDGLHPAPSAPGGTHTGGGKAAPPQPQASAVLMAWAWLVLALFGSESPARGLRWALERGSTVLRAAGCPFASCAPNAFPSATARPSGACFDCDLLKHGQHKPRPSKGWSVGSAYACRPPPA